MEPVRENFIITDEMMGHHCPLCDKDKGPMGLASLQTHFASSLHFSIRMTSSLKLIDDRKHKIEGRLNVTVFLCCWFLIIQQMQLVLLEQLLGLLLLLEQLVQHN
jgi:hypothetical protein